MEVNIGLKVAGASFDGYTIVYMGRDFSLFYSFARFLILRIAILKCSLTT